jgi:hypothetical protein
MLPSYARRLSNKNVTSIPEEEEYIPREDQDKPILRVKETPDFGKPASLEDINKAFSDSNATNLIFDEIRNNKITSTFRENDAYNLNILPSNASEHSQQASLDEDWCELTVNTKEQVGSYKDRIGRTIPLYVEKIPPKQSSESLNSKPQRNMETFTGTTPQERKKEVVNIISEKEEVPLVRYKRAANESVRRQEIGLNANKNHSQSFTSKDTCREGYNGYNMVDGHEKRVRNLVDTNRNHYNSYIVPQKGTDTDGQIPHVAEKTQRPEVEDFKRHLAIGDTSTYTASYKAAIPVLSNAKVIIEGRTGGGVSNVSQCSVKPKTHRLIKKEDAQFSSEHGQYVFEHGSSIKSDPIPSTRIALPENELRQKSVETGISCRAKVEPSMNMRDAFMVDGKRQVPILAEANIRSDQERDLAEDDPELESIFIQQRLEECRIVSETVLLNDSTIEVPGVYGEAGPEGISTMPGIVPTNRLPEKSSDGRVILDPEKKEFIVHRPRHVLGSSDAQPSDAVLVDASSYKGERITIPKERKNAEKEKLNREARIDSYDVNHQMVHANSRIPINIGSVNISREQNRAMFNENVKHHQRPEHIVSSSDAQESKGFFKGFMDSISYLVPQTTPKQQMVSGSEQFKLPTKYRESNLAQPSIGKTAPRKDEIVQLGRMGNSNVAVSKHVDLNMVKNHAKRGLEDSDRLTSKTVGKRGVHRDVRIPGESEFTLSGRGEDASRPPSAASDAGSVCRPDLDSRRKNEISVSPRC